MMGEVVAHVVRRDENLREPVLLDVVGGLASIVRTRHPAVFGNRAKSILNLVERHVWQHPHKRVQQRVAADGKQGQHENLATKEAKAVAAMLRCEQPGEPWLHHPIRRHAACVAAYLPPKARSLDWVEGVEQEVRLVRAELVAVMVGVTSAVVVRASAEWQPAEDVDANNVVDLPIREQQTVRGFVMKDVHADLHHRHEHDANHIGPPGVEQRRRPHNSDRCDE